MTYVPTIYVNGVRLTGGVKIHEQRDVGHWVHTVHIEAPDFEVHRKKDDGK